MNNATAVQSGAVISDVHRQGFVRTYIFSLDHKVIGIQYTVTFIVVFLLAGLLAMAMRAELAHSGMQFMNHQQYNGTMSLHGILMVAVAVAAVIEHDGRYLITQRNANAVLPLLWEFPGGRIEGDESERDALIREVAGRIGVEVEVGPKLGEHVHDYTDYCVQLTMYSCALPAEARPYPASVADLRWVTSREFLDYDFPPADETTMSKLLGLVRN